MGATESRVTTETKLARIAWLSGSDPTKTFSNLMHHVNEDPLRECYHLLEGRKAAGTDGVTKEEYGKNLKANLKELISKMKRMSYRPRPMRRVEIPKPGMRGNYRRLGISNFEDKLVQKQFQRILENIYEPIFLPSSYGFRRGIGCHDAVRALSGYLYKEKVTTVLDVDLAKYFDSIDHRILKTILQYKVKDEKFVRYIVRMFKAGVLAKGELQVTDEGVAQGSCCSPILANILAHYVIDDWFEKTVKAHCQGKSELFRYCDDRVICCEHYTDAERIRTALCKRLGRFKLQMNEDKTKLIRWDPNQRRASFSFLGFTFYWGKSRAGTRIPKVQTDGKRMRAKLKYVNQWAKAVRHQGKAEVIGKSFSKKLQGHIQYYGVSYNTVRVATFIYHAKRSMFYWLNRRSQKRSFTWEQFERFEQRHPLPKARVYHRLF